MKIKTDGTAPNKRASEQRAPRLAYLSRSLGTKREGSSAGPETDDWDKVEREWFCTSETLVTGIGESAGDTPPGKEALEEDSDRRGGITAAAFWGSGFLRTGEVVVGEVTGMGG